ncbi:MAG: peptidylprolyl isomerase, partial [Marinilabiliales bacterium]
MATLQKIRNRAGLLIAIIVGMALFAFVLGDLFKSGKSVFGNSENEIASIDGQGVPLQYFQAKVDEFVENYKNNSGQSDVDEKTIEMLREQVWDYVLREALLGKEYEELGLAVHPDELFDMVQGNNIDPQIQQIPIFRDENGRFDRAKVIQYLKSLEQNPEQKDIWLAFEDGLMKTRIATKYNNLIKKGYYVTNLEAQEEFESKNKKVNLSYVALRYNAISDSSIQVTEKDLQSYYEEHKSKYEQKASRDMDYVVFDIAASQDDIAATEQWVADLKEDFATAEDDLRFAAMNTDIPENYRYLKRDELSEALDSTFFDTLVGTVVGPYLEGEAYKITKLVDRKMVADSVKASHILLSPQALQANLDMLNKMADSLIDIIEADPTQFELLAMEYNTDKTKETGGDLGWFDNKSMVQPFSDSCFFSPKGHVARVATQFGVHIFKVVDKSEESEMVKLATIARTIEPSSATYQQIYSEASEFAGLNNTKEKFESFVNENGLAKRIANNVLENDKQISGLDNPREMIRWAYKAEKGDVSSVFEIGDRFVVALLTETREEGIASLDQVRTEIEINVTKEKKAEKLMNNIESKISSVKGIEELAAALNTELRTAENISFSMSNVPGLGVEPALVGAAVSVDQGQMYGPIEGNNGVYVI